MHVGNIINLALHIFLLSLQQVSADAPPGYTLVIEQAVGECNGDGTTKTEMYRISHQRKDTEEKLVIG